MGTINRLNNKLNHLGLTPEQLPYAISIHHSKERSNSALEDEEMEKTYAIQLSTRNRFTGPDIIKEKEKTYAVVLSAVRR